MLTRISMSRRLEPDFLALVSEHEETLLRAARLLTGDWERAELLLQDTLAWAHAGWEALSVDEVAALRIQQRLIANYLAGQPGAPAIGDPATGPEPAAEIDVVRTDRIDRTDLDRPTTAGRPRSASGPEPTGRPGRSGAGPARAGAGPGGAGSGGAGRTGAGAAGAGPDDAGRPGAGAVGVSAAGPGRAGRSGAGAAGAGRSGAGAAGAGRGGAAGGRPALVDGLAELSAEDRAVVVSRYYVGLSTTEIGEILGVDADEVAEVAARAYATLRRGQ
ncbi:MAG: hypothetical protein V7637_4996 [Mycobacteriales bacterium]|jgi:DNA-directed RNA polymerase specialized sigma24 family protein